MKKFNKFLWRVVGTVAAYAVFLFLFLIAVIFMIYDSDMAITNLSVIVFLGFILAAAAIIALLVNLVLSAVSFDKAKGKLLAIPGFSVERFEREIERHPKPMNVLLCSDAICYLDGCKTKVVPIGEIVWAYQDTMPQNGFPCLTVYTADGSRYRIMTSASNVRLTKINLGDIMGRYILRLIARKNKGALIGYDDNIEMMRKQNFNLLLSRTMGREIVDSARLESEYIQNDYYHKDMQ